MPRYVIKPRPDQDLYVYWSTVTEGPVAFGDRAWILTALFRYGEDRATSNLRLDRADRRGTSALWPTIDEPAYGWDARWFIYDQRGWVHRDRLRELCRRLDEDADLSDLITPFDNDDDPQHAEQGHDQDVTSDEGRTDRGSGPTAA